MNTPHRFLTKHRQARLIAWTKAMIAWIVATLFAPGPNPPSVRHIEQRFELFWLDWPTELVLRLAFQRAVERFGRRTRLRIPPRNHAHAGFTRKTNPATRRLRLAVGSRVLRLMRTGDFAQRLSRLLAILANPDAFARQHLRARIRHGLTRLWPLLLSAPTADACVSLVTLTPSAADSS